MKKLNKFFAVLVALAMMATLCVSMAFAFDDNVPAGDNVSENAANAYLVKYLKIKEGVTIPDDTYTFTFEPVASSTVTAADLTAYGDDIIPQDITIKARDMTPSDSDKDDGALVYAKSIDDIFDGIDFPKAGEYCYDVSETLPVKGENDIGDYTANTQSYRLRIYVERQLKVVGYDEETGDPIYGTEYETVINKITVQDEKTKKNVEIDDPSVIAVPTETPGETTQKPLTQEEIEASNVEGFTFVNKYDLDENHDTDKNDKGAFYAEKETKGAYGDDTQKFPVTFTVTWPADGSYDKGDKALNLYTNNDEGEAVALTDKDGNPIALAKDANADTWSATVELANGEYAYFKYLPKGAKVTVSENLTASDINNAAWYNQSTVSTTNGTAGALNEAMKDAEGNDVAKKTKDTQNPKKTVITADDVEYTAHALAADKKTNDSAKVTNDSVYEPSTTGILLSNLPYIVLALVAIGGMVAYVVIRRRQSDEA